MLVTLERSSFMHLNIPIFSLFPKSYEIFCRTNFVFCGKRRFNIPVVTVTFLTKLTRMQHLKKIHLTLYFLLFLAKISKTQQPFFSSYLCVTDSKLIPIRRLCDLTLCATSTNIQHLEYSCSDNHYLLGALGNPTSGHLNVENSFPIFT